MNETHLIDGAMGRPHVNALDIRMHNASLFGDGVYITEGLDGLPVTVVDANTVSVGRGVMLINGARITQEEKIDLTIESGSQGMNRNDLLVATYTYDAANTRCEDVNLEIVTGTPTAGTATDPAIHAGTLLDINNADLVEGVSTVQVPIARIPLTGTTVGAPAILAKKFGTIQDIRDSVSQINQYPGGMSGNVIDQSWHVLPLGGNRVALLFRAAPWYTALSAKEYYYKAPLPIEVKKVLFSCAESTQWRCDRTRVTFNEGDTTVINIAVNIDRDASGGTVQNLFTSQSKR